MTGIITQPRTLVQCVVGGGGAALPAQKLGNNFSNGKLRTPRKIRPRTEGPQDPLPPPFPASLPDHPRIQSTGPGPGMWESPQSPSVCKVGYTTSLLPSSSLCLHLSPAFGLSPFCCSTCRGNGGQLVTSPQRRSLLCHKEENDSVSSWPSPLQPGVIPVPLTFPHMSCFFSSSSCHPSNSQL